MLSEGREDKLYGDILSIMLAQRIPKVLLSEHRQKNQLLLDTS